MMNGKYALITGSSHGIGKAIAKECARRGYGLLLVALPDKMLEQTEKELRDGYDVELHVLGIDLTEEGSDERVFEWYRSLDVSLELLVNNAGFGTSGWFEDVPIEVYRRMMRLNNEAMVGLTYYFLPELKKRDRAYILNVGSMESFMPLPYKTVYTGTKQFSYGFSMALREEAKQFGVSVSLLCPGPVVTNEEGLRRLESQGAKAKLVAKMPDYVARKAIRQTLAGKAIVIPGSVNALSKRLGDIMPRGPKMRILERLFRVYVKKDE